MKVAPPHLGQTVEAGSFIFDVTVTYISFLYIEKSRHYCYSHTLTVEPLVFLGLTATDEAWYSSASSKKKVSTQLWK